METLYRKVAVIERLPENNGFYDTNLGLKKFINGEWTCTNLKQSFPSIFYEEIPDPTAQLKADKAELLQALEKIFKIGYKPYRNTRNEELEIIDIARNLLNKFQKHKQ